MKKKNQTIIILTFIIVTILAIAIWLVCSNSNASSGRTDDVEENASTQSATEIQESATTQTNEQQTTESATTQTSEQQPTESATASASAESQPTAGQRIAFIMQQSAGTEVDVAGLSEEEIAQLFYATTITDEVFLRINGVSYQENNEISREDLRYLRVLHVGIDGSTYIGELIVNQSICEDILEIMQELYRAEYPIEKMVLIDEYGGDDEASMEENNTSAFNYRNISGSGKLSKHSYGLAIDVNPLYNPYVKNTAEETICQPENASDYINRSSEFSYKIDENDLCYQLFIAHGFTWGGSWNSVKDYQHFEK